LVRSASWILDRSDLLNITLQFAVVAVADGGMWATRQRRCHCPEATAVTNYFGFRGSPQALLPSIEVRPEELPFPENL
jgi:hypothetical protein